MATTDKAPEKAESDSPYKVKAATDANSAVNGLKERMERHAKLSAEFYAKQNELNAARFELRSFLDSTPDKADDKLKALMASKSAALASMGGGVDWEGFFKDATHAAVILREGL